MKINWFKFSYGFIILLMSLLIVQYAAQVYAGGHSWKTGDWLINYSDGLIRRGLSGSISLFISQIFSANVKWITFSIQVTIFVIFIALTLKELYKFKKFPKSIFLLLSPGFAFMFWVNDPAVAFRKEICIYLALVLLLKAFQRDEVRLTQYWTSIIIFIFAGFSHEIIVFFLPFFIFPIFNYYSRNNLNFNSIIKFSTPFIFISIVVVAISIFYKGSQQSMDVICDSLKQYNLSHDICDGAISWLQYDARFGFESVLKLGSEVWLNYLFLIVVTMLPLFLLSSDKYFWIVICVGALFMLPLFFLAIDYGRFISIFYTSIVLLAIWTRPQAIMQMWPINGFVGFLYCFFWALPNCCKNSPGKGILGDALSSALNF